MSATPADPSAVGSSYRRGPHIVAVLVAVALFPLVFVGAGVTSKEVGLAYPDWPTSSGHLINPPHWWQIEATRWEHGHRLLGWVVGMLATALAVLSWPRGGVVRVLSLVTLGAIGIQGVLGGLRVIEMSTTWAMVHGIWAHGCFCLACSAALVTSSSWHSNRGRYDLSGGETLFRRLCLAGSAAIFLQLVLGAAQRHLASNGALIAHLLWAVAVTLLVGWIVIWVVGQHPGRDLMETLSWLLGGLMVVQLMLGGVAWVVTVAGGVRSPLLIWLIPSAHVAVGALLLGSCVLLTLCAYRMFHVAPLPLEARGPARVATP